jgi:cell wall-associated NlpC family hydrolase
MATAEQISSFINNVYQGAQDGQTKYGIFASVTIAQGALESTWGTSPLAQTDNNLFGIKTGGAHDPSITISQGTAPTDGTGGYYCHYNSWADSILDHGYFLKNNSRYTQAGVFTATTPEDQITAIMNAGYAQNADGSINTQYAPDIIATINANNLKQYDTGSTGGGGDPDASTKIESAVTWMINIANDESHGYDQDSRWGPDYDCSSLVISGYEQAGIKLKTNGATYTGDMKEVALNTGFTVVDWGNDTSKLLRGDIILNETHHVCCYIGNGQIVQASINELGTTTGGQTGDQTGKEIYVRDYYTYRYGWDCVLRYGNGTTGGGTGGTGTGGTGGVPSDDKFGDDYFEEYESYFEKYDDLSEVYKKLITTPYIMNQLSSEQVLFIRTLNFNDKVRMKFTFDHSKRYIGKNFVGKKLTFDNKEHIIKDVKSDGLMVLSYGGSVCYDYLNPKYIYQDDIEKQQTKSINVAKIKAHIQEEIEQALEEEEQNNEN